jgi:hypothetical protein
MTMAAMVATSTLLLCGAVLAAPQVVIDTDFGVPGKAFSDTNAEKGNRITGSLPEGWGENSGWKDQVVAEYTTLTEEGRSFLHISQTSGGGLQFCHSLPGLEKEAGYYRLTFTARSTSGGSLGVRYNGAPYDTVWSASPNIGPAWRDFAFDFRLEPKPQDLGLYFYVSGNGTLDLQCLKLARLSRQDLIDEIKARNPEGGQGNLVRLSRFPLGLQSGWSIDREFSDGDQVSVETDPTVIGPSGCPALHIQAPNGIKVYSAPFGVPWSFEPHVLSLYVRGDWDGSLVVAGGVVQGCGGVPLKRSGTEWQRVEAPFSPILMAPAHHLQISGGGDLWIDGLQVERGSQATAYAPQKPVEVSLALADSEASSARVVFADEPGEAEFRVVGECPGGTLKARLVNLYDETRELPAVALGGASITSGVLSLPAFAERPLGPQRLEAWVEDAAGQKVSAENEVVFYRLHRPRHWGRDAPNSFFGTHTLSTNRHLTMAKAAGCNWVRLHDAGTEYIGWSFLEAEKGKWEFRDAALRRYRDHNLKILGLLSTSPGWASNWGKPCTGYFDRYLEPLNMDDWANAVRTIVSHHRDLIDTWEIWNEPWGSAFWSWKYDETNGTDWLAHFVPSETPAADYARLQKVAYAAAHEVDPAVTILGFNTYGSTDGGKWTRAVMDDGGVDTCDAMSYHHYENGLTGMPNDPSERAYQAAWEPVLAKHGQPPKPVWMSEGAPLSGDPSNGFYRYTLPDENGEDTWHIADRLARYVVSHRATGEKHAFLYTMHGHSTFGGGMQWSTLITADGYLHPSAAAHSACAWLLEDTDFVRLVTLADGVYGYLFAGPRRAVAVISTSPEHAAYALPTAPNVQLSDLFGNPLAPGAGIDDRVHYVACDAGLPALEAALGLQH